MGLYGEKLEEDHVDSRDQELQTEQRQKKANLAHQGIQKKN